MLRPSGRANTRCSGCQFEPGGLHFIAQAIPVAVIDRCMTPVGARNGFAEPRDRKPKSRLSRSHPAAETGGPAFERAEFPANWGSFVRDLEPPVRTGVRGGGCSPHRTGLPSQNSQITGKILGILMF